MRRVAERYITADNMSMPKKGFNLPLDHWMKTSTAIQDYARQHLDALERRDVFDKKTVEKWWRRRDQGVYFSKIWQLVTTEVWMDEYIDA
jgi:asparagine synthase (glutamine-hydrolysing)